MGRLMGMSIPCLMCQDSEQRARVYEKYRVYNVSLSIMMAGLLVDEHYNVGRIPLRLFARLGRMGVDGGCSRMFTGFSGVYMFSFFENAWHFAE